jgi:hypothetical protein
MLHDQPFVAFGDNCFEGVWKDQMQECLLTLGGVSWSREHEFLERPGINQMCGSFVSVQRFPFP